MEKNLKNPFISGIFIFCAALACLACMFLPPMYLLAPALTAFALFESKKPLPAAVCVAACCLFGSCMLYGTEAASLAIALPLVSAGAGSGFVLYFMQKKRSSGFNTVFAMSLLTGGSLYLAITLPGVLLGQGAFAIVETTARSFSESLRATGAAGMLGFSDAMLSSLPQYAKDTVVACCCSLAGICSLSNTIVFRFLARKKRAAYGIAPMNPFSMWSVSDEYMRGIIIPLAGGLYMLLTESDFAEPVLLAVTTLITIPIGITGLAMIDWFILQSGGNIRLKRIVAYAAVAVLFRFAGSALLTLGFIERIMHIRSRLRFVRVSGRNDRGNKGEK